MVWFVCGVIALIIEPVYGEHLQMANETGTQSIRTRQHQHQSQHQYVFSKPANKQQSNRGRSNGLNELRKNLTQQKLWERQGDDPDQNSVHRSPIHLIHQKIQQSDVSTQYTVHIHLVLMMTKLIPICPIYFRNYFVTHSHCVEFFFVFFVFVFLELFLARLVIGVSKRSHP